MTDAPQFPSLTPDPLRAAEGARARKPDAARGASPAFEALLDRLTARAAELDEKKHSLSTPEDVHDALDVARASLEDACTLSERLLEAYRQARQDGSAAAGEVRP